MMNKAMERKLDGGECIDVSDRPRTVTGDYVLERFVEDADYCDAKTEEWIRSIGKTLRPVAYVLRSGERGVFPPGTYLASVSNRHYSEGRSEVIECVFLR